MLKVHFASKIPWMWKATEEMLNLKNTAIHAGVSRANFGNNFIPTKIFTFSFQVSCPVFLCLLGK